MRFAVVFLYIAQHVLPRLTREVIDADLAPDVTSRQNAEVPFHERTKLILVCFRGNESAHSLNVLKLLAIAALD